MSIQYSIPAACAATLAKWQSHPFYTSAVVLGLDMGLEGIDVCVRRGRELLYDGGKGKERRLRRSLTCQSCQRRSGRKALRPTRSGEAA